MKLEPAKNKILISSLNLGTYVYDNTIVNEADTLNAIVYKQIPEYKSDATLQLGSAMYLWFTVNPAKLTVDTSKTVTDTIPAVPPSDNKSN
jgi:hypothetical protein